MGKISEFIGYMEAKHIRSGDRVPEIAVNNGEVRPLELESDGFCGIKRILRCLEKPVSLDIFYIKNPLTGKELSFGVGRCIEQAYREQNAVPASDYPLGCRVCSYVKNTLVRL